MIGNELKIGLFALRDIKQGQELTFDYDFETFFEESKECLCGSENCRGSLSKKKSNFPRVLKNNEAKIHAKIEKEIFQSLEELFNYESSEEEEKPKKTPRQILNTKDSNQVKPKKKLVFLLRNKKRVMKSRYNSYCKYYTEFKKFEKVNGYFPWEDESKYLREIGISIEDRELIGYTSLRKSKLKAMHTMTQNIKKKPRKKKKEEKDEKVEDFIPNEKIKINLTKELIKDKK